MTEEKGQVHCDRWSLSSFLHQYSQQGFPPCTTRTQFPVALDAAGAASMINATFPIVSMVINDAAPIFSGAIQLIATGASKPWLRKILPSVQNCLLVKAAATDSIHGEMTSQSGNRNMTRA
ncbi:hypothetical protein [Desulfovibrio inopinatus]|uniref:hypothetical protein n=1 Tax=Desulfovibrio inopinatus TaxID=102109 RepID=UPI000487906B|nr:hypothetical protein [Desulfovibrio inopinatus]